MYIVIEGQDGTGKSTQAELLKEHFTKLGKKVVVLEEPDGDLPQAHDLHDMILTPQGKFSTDPDDYIIATKNPSGLNNGGGKGDIIINNYSNAQVEAKQDDMGNTVIMISQKVAMDYANGSNGWESAIMARQARGAGRNLAM